MEEEVATECISDNGEEAGRRAAKGIRNQRLFSKCLNHTDH